MSEELETCSWCGADIPAGDEIKMTINDIEEVFCSQDCLDDFKREALVEEGEG